ncbi:type III-A CRISPR-associated protein Cas10/Csm1 [Limnospira fusiformis KN01]|uniref:type III-A CRISPR-associated protein Cas10/Csm1 n=1 Tax=Limnospira TaxID=2596745 RepID=UPI0002804375|nr:MULTISPECIES: type III-A CRISPR-associated protein Cas10/Csm1 [Limnospira]EKD07451.1 CRISPR-associated protein Csm1 family [Arthrospira platensis C1]QJB25778.1 type III-A CRISPR-associated protein Cas10/Csm1 [Limnospira fusiformis SAG 85.79]MDT9186385.1 type III-A CRISPR-associated protein Cas10/Csm1 [Limnospira sp. PMC 894.15]MDT9196763.1 type III-A CRISPR-associated protein Cas10/Csm1 [Limnospira sp. PMC 1042.18]ULB47079.1 type III-A CRISPR-associated protein Cas10/Csm1 [Limnospira fusifo
MVNSTAPNIIALQVIREAVWHLANWAQAKWPPNFNVPEENPAIARAKQLLSWTETSQIQPLHLLFDAVNLSQPQSHQHYVPAIAIEDSNPTIPYPTNEPVQAEQINFLQQKIRETIANLRLEDWENLSLLTLLLEKFGSCLSLGFENVAFYDLVKSTAAIAAILSNDYQASKISLIAGDLSGIQDFIYTISSDGALKSLRARSFYLELVTEEVAQQLLNKLNIPRTNIIYVGGGNLYLLAPEQNNNENLVEPIRDAFNEWLIDEFQGKVFLSLGTQNFDIEEIGTAKFAQQWATITQNLALQKARKFDHHLDNFLAIQETYEPCRVCHRDDEENLKPLNHQEADSVLACPTCRQMFRLGSELFRVDAIVRSPVRDSIAKALDSLQIKLPGQSIYYHLFRGKQQVKNLEESETVFLVNNWKVADYQNGNSVSLLLGNYAQNSQEEYGTMTANEMADLAKKDGCIPRVGYLRMDVDKLGQIFAKGLGNDQTLPRLAGLSRQMSYFFKVYLNSLAQFRQENLHNTVFHRLTGERQNLVFIYAGGDDLFVSGAWHEVVEFAFDVYQCFRAYTGHHPDISLSGGISLSVAKFPLYQAAEESGQAEDQAKANGRDSLGLFGSVFKWDEWLGTELKNLPNMPRSPHNFLKPKELQTYLANEISPSLWGVLPFVKQLHPSLEINYSRSFIRNLLATAELQDKMIKEAASKPQEYQWDVRYFLHLPKIAYTLARLPDHVRNHPNFEPIRTSLKNPYNAPYFRAIATWLEMLNRSSINSE